MLSRLDNDKHLGHVIAESTASLTSMEPRDLAHLEEPPSGAGDDIKDGAATMHVVAM